MPNWKKLITSGSDAELNSLNATSALTASGINYPSADGDNGDVLITDGAGNLSFTRTTVYANVKNVHGSELVKGMPVHVTGAAGNTSEVIAASASNAATMPAHFILNETLADDAEGLAIAIGYINGVNTGDFNEGDTVYVGADSGYTNVKPTGSNLIQNLGIVDKVDASNGSGFVLGAGRSNDVPNISPGYAWVGNSDSVATAVATSSFSVASANTASYVAAANIDGTIDISDQTNLAGGTNLTLSGDTMNLDANISLTTITASSDISSSGDIRGSEFYVNQKPLANTSGDTIRFGWSADMPIEIGKDNNPIKLVGQVTASIISASSGITGDLTGTATNATNVNVGNSDDSSTYYILGALGTGNQALKRDSGITFNSSTNTLNVGGLDTSGRIFIGANDIELRGDANNFIVYNGGLQAEGAITASNDITTEGSLITTKTGSVTDPALLIGVNSGYLAGNNTGIILEDLVPGTNFFVPYFVSNGAKIFGFGTVMQMEKNIDMQSNKIYFDGDSTNTYIASNADDPEDLEIHADQDIILGPINGQVIANSNISASGAITSSDVYINDWGSVSASLASAGGGGAVATYTNGSNDRIITSTGTDGINGEANLTFDGSSLTLTGNLTSSGVISSSGTSDNFFGGRLVLDNAKYIAGTETGGTTRNILSIDGSDITQVANGNLATNIKGTSISVDNALTVDTGNFTVTNGNIRLQTNNTQITGKLTGGAERDIIGFNASDVVVVGNTTTDEVQLTGNTKVVGNLTLDDSTNVTLTITGSIQHKFPDATYAYQGELSPLAGTALTAGEIYHYSGSGWVVADASDDTATKHLGVAVSSTDVMIRGYIRNTAYAGLGTGNVIYLSTTAGDVTITPPGTPGEYVRVLGYCVDGTTRVIYFNPSQDWIEL